MHYTCNRHPDSLCVSNAKQRVTHWIPVPLVVYPIFPYICFVTNHRDCLQLKQNSLQNNIYFVIVLKCPLDLNHNDVTESSLYVIIRLERRHSYIIMYQSLYMCRNVYRIETYTPNHTLYIICVCTSYAYHIHVV